MTFIKGDCAGACRFAFAPEGRRLIHFDDAVFRAPFVERVRPVALSCKKGRERRRRRQTPFDPDMREPVRKTLGGVMREAHGLQIEHEIERVDGGIAAQMELRTHGGEFR